MAVIKGSGNSKLGWFLSRWHPLEACGASAPAGCSQVCCHPPIPAHPQPRNIPSPGSASLRLFLSLFNSETVKPRSQTYSPSEGGREAGQCFLPRCLSTPCFCELCPGDEALLFAGYPALSWLKEIRENNWDGNPGHPRIKSRQHILFPHAPPPVFELP